MPRCRAGSSTAGRFENYLGEQNLEAGIDLFGGSFITQVEVGDPHRVTIVRGGPGGEESTVQARWLVDASGRAFILKKKLGLLEDNGHMVNSAWFRLAGGLDIEDWADSDDEEFFGRMSERGLRQFSTNHLCGKGYWMWMIQLSSGSISIGIVADSNFHSMDRMDTLEKAIEWIREHEPQLGESIDARRDQVQDFLEDRELLLRVQAVLLGQRPLVPGGRGRAVPGSVLFTRLGLHRALQHVQHRPDHARARRRGRREAG